MSNVAALQHRLLELRKFRNDLLQISKEAFMAAPPMPAPQGAMPPGGAPPGGMPVDPATGMPIDPATGMPIDPNTGMPMGGPPPGMPPGGGMPVDPATGMPMGGPPPGGAPPPQGGGITPEMLDELMGVVEEMAAGIEMMGQKLAKLESMTQESMARCDELEQALAAMSSGMGAGV